jgi:hypothetical protein
MLSGRASTLPKSGREGLSFPRFRHCAVTCWTVAEIPEELRKLAAGHKLPGIHGRYVSVPDAQMVRVSPRN